MATMSEQERSERFEAQGLKLVLAVPDDIQVFTCGPLPFMRLVRSTLLDRGVPPARIRYEVFGPDLWAAQSSPDSGS